jgi:hypothetical protein
MNPVLALAWYLGLWAWLVWMSRVTGMFRCWNTFTLLGLVLLLHHGLAVPFAWTVVDDAMGFHLPSETKWLWIGNLALMFAFVPIGATLVSDLLGYHPEELMQRPAITSSSGASALFVPFAIVALIFVSVVVYRAASGLTLTSFILTNLTAEQYQAAREAFGEAFGSLGGAISYIASIALYSIVPLGSVYFYFAMKERKWYWVPLVGTVLLSAIAGLVSGQKYIAFGLAIPLVLGVLLTRHGMRMRLTSGSVIAALVVLIGAFPYLYMVQYPQFSYLEGLRATWFRLTLETNRALQLFYFTYPGVHQFLGGASSRYVATLLGSWAMPPHTYIPTELFGVTDTTWNVAFIGDAWADFGILGTVMSSLMVGGLLQGYNVWFARSARTRLQAAAFAVLCGAAMRLASVGLPTALLTFGLGTTFLAYCLLAGSATAQPGRLGLRLTPSSPHS